MNVWKIPGTIAEKYQGAGMALAAITGDTVIDLIYLSEVFPYETDGFDEYAVRDLLERPEIGPFVRRLQPLGSVSVGMCSCWEFVEL